MQTKLLPELLATSAGQRADTILRKCVHCGFCTATCPTYQLLGDELDSPRGRIYLVKQMLEGEPVTGKTRLHFDRCLTCRSCETTCPSGVDYGQLIDIGRLHIDKQIPRPWHQRLSRWLLRKTIPNEDRFRLLLNTGQRLRFLLPTALRQKLPPRFAPTAVPQTQHERKMLITGACGQSTTHPHFDTLTATILDRFNIQAIHDRRSGCCGAISQHLAAEQEARIRMRHNIDLWYEHLQQGVEAIISTASGCGVHLKEYGVLFADDPDYADKARLVSEHVRDLSEVLASLPLKEQISQPVRTSVAFHAPCTLQHGQQIVNRIEPMLQSCGYQLLTVQDSHLCCGSAGTYSILQPDLATRLRDNKLAHLQQQQPNQIATANIGCLYHLQAGTDIPVRHWLELVADSMGITPAERI